MQLKIKDLILDDFVTSCKFHEFDPEVIACGTIAGVVSLWRLSDESEHEELERFRGNRGTSRVVLFRKDGKILSGGSDGKVRIVDYETKTQEILRTTDQEVYSCESMDDNCVIVGGDAGVVEVFDLRVPRKKILKKPILQFRDQEDYINSLLWNEEKHHIISLSGDGYLAVYDVRKLEKKTRDRVGPRGWQYSSFGKRGRLEARSDTMDDEMCCLTLLQNGNKLVCGSNSGYLNIFNYGDFGDYRDRCIVRKNEPIDCIEKFTENLCFTGSSDGFIRLVHVSPNRLFSDFAKHDSTLEDLESLPIEHLSLNHGKSLLASIAHDNRIKFWCTETAVLAAKEAEELVNQGDQKLQKVKLQMRWSFPLSGSIEVSFDRNRVLTNYAGFRLAVETRFADSLLFRNKSTFLNYTVVEEEFQFCQDSSCSLTRHADCESVGDLQNFIPELNEFQDLVDLDTGLHLTIRGSLGKLRNETWFLVNFVETQKQIRIWDDVEGIFGIGNRKTGCQKLKSQILIFDFFRQRLVSKNEIDETKVDFSEYSEFVNSTRLQSSSLRFTVYEPRVCSFPLTSSFNWLVELATHERCLVLPSSLYQVLQTYSKENLTRVQNSTNLPIFSFFLDYSRKKRIELRLEDLVYEGKVCVKRRKISKFWNSTILLGYEVLSALSRRNHSAIVFSTPTDLRIGFFSSNSTDTGICVDSNQKTCQGEQVFFWDTNSCHDPTCDEFYFAEVENLRCVTSKTWLGFVIFGFVFLFLLELLVLNWTRLLTREARIKLE